MTPKYAAEMARDIYQIKSTILRKRFINKYKSDFDFNSNNKKEIKSKTGALVFLKSEHTMGVAAQGKSPKYSADAVIALKGTASGYDLLTDLNAGIKRAPTGGPVHQGFFYTFNDLVKQIEEFSHKLPSSVNTIHCIGHSLGGALATLVADWLSANTAKTIKLYTFGSPRVGLEFFSSGCRKRIGDSNIYRVYHLHDAVPMVPTWPFIHVPNGGVGDFALPSPSSMNPITHHSIATYVQSVAPNENDSLGWEDIRRLRPVSAFERDIENWLKSDSMLALSLNTAKLASDALLWVIEKVAKLAGIALVIGSGITFTILDRLSILMHKAYKFSKETSFWVYRLMKRLSQLIGIKVTKDVNFTVSFIRSIFLRLHRAVSDLVLRAGRHVD